MPVAAPALAGARDDDALVRLVEVGQQHVLVGVVDQRARRDGNDQVLTALAEFLLAHAGLAARGAPVVLAGEVEQRVLVDVGHEHDRPAVATVTPVGPALGHVLLAPERHAAVAAVTGLDVNRGFIDEHDANDTRERSARDVRIARATPRRGAAAGSRSFTAAWRGHFARRSIASRTSSRTVASLTQARPSVHWNPCNSSEGARSLMR